VNDSYVKKIINDKKDIWVLRSIGKIDEVNIIKIILNGKVIRNYDFNELNKNEYIKRNKIEYNDK
jgi:hypothetical protein